ncbi:hypothetical protein AB205_0139270, partial [Aquarana catesbeiana]
MCVGPAMREDWRPLVFSLFFRCALDRLRGEVGGRLSFLFSSDVCWTGYEGRLEAACLFSFLQVCIGPSKRGGWRPFVFSLFFRCVL